MEETESNKATMQWIRVRTDSQHIGGTPVASFRRSVRLRSYYDHLNFRTREETYRSRREQDRFLHKGNDEGVNSHSHSDKKSTAKRSQQRSVLENVWQLIFRCAKA